jgi:dienelactone hydrolase
MNDCANRLWPALWAAGGKRFLGVYVTHLVFLSTALALTCLAPAAARPTPLWHHLQSGPHAVGFRVWWKYDYSRTWSDRSPGEEQQAGESGFRPIRISVWYPAIKPPAASPMLFAGYVDTPVENKDFAGLQQELRTYDIGGSGKGLRGIFKTESALEGLLKTPSAAFLKAPAARGSFPLVVYSLGQNDYTQENVVLWEFLASHGYVVATIPHMGTSPRRFHLFIDDPCSYEAQVRDLEYLTAFMRDLDYVDKTKVAAAGHSMGGVYALLLAMRNSRIRAVVGLDGSFTITQSPYAYKYWETPDYDAARFKVPLLQMYKPAESTMHLVDGLRYSDRYLVKLPHAVHADFSSYPMLTFHTEPSELDPYALTIRNQETAEAEHELVCRYVLAFLNAHLKRDERAMGFISKPPDSDEIPMGLVEYQYRAGLKAPTEEEFSTLVSRDGFDRTAALYHQWQKKYSNQTLIREKVLKRIGYEFLWAGQPARSIDIFRLNVEAHPLSADAYDSLAEGYLANGKKDLALKYYRKSLELNPQNKGAQEKIGQLERGS